MKVDKKKTAGLMGVLYHLQEEKKFPKPFPTPRTTEPLNPWALHGRQALVQTKALLQQRLFRH
ncbi:MAG: hypothetical protein AB1798_15200 [Spirochaetota bacterium]